MDNSTTGTQHENSTSAEVQFTPQPVIAKYNASGAPSLVPAEEPVTAKRTEEADHDLTCYPPLSAAIRCRHKVLQLGGGDDDLKSSMVSIFAKADIDCTNYDPTNGQLRDLVDSYALGTLLRDAEASEFLAAVATPDCSTFPFSLGPGGPPALRGKSGGDRYGFKNNSAANIERCRKHNIYLVNIARTLRLLAGKGIPWILGIPFHHADLASALDLDEYISLLKTTGVSQTKGVQCPFGAPAATPTTFITFGVDMKDMPTACPHPMRRWKYPGPLHCSTLARHPPAT